MLFESIFQIYFMRLKSAFLLLLVLFSYGLNAQSNWLNSAGGTANDEAIKNCSDKSGNLYTTGYYSVTSSFENSVLTALGSGDIFIAKQNSTGSYVWAVSAGGVLSDRPYDISTDNNGNLFVTGYYSGQAVFGSNALNSNNNSQDIFVAKIDTAGNFIWVKSFGGNENDLGLALACDSTGSVIVTGQFKAVSDFDGITLTSTTDTTGNFTYDIFICKITSSGNVDWVKQGAAKFEDRGLAITTDEDNNIYLAGQFSDTLTFNNTYSNNGYNVCFVMKMDSLGNEKWFDKLFATQVIIYDMDFNAGAVFITGDFKGTLSVIGNGIETLQSAFPNKFFVLKLDTSGNVLRKVANGSNYSLSSLSIAADSLGNAYCTGTFKCFLTEYIDSVTTGIFNSVGFKDIFVSKFDSALSRVWSRQFGGPGDDYCSAISLVQNEPAISGSYETQFNVPSTNGFIVNTANVNSSGAGPNQISNFCSDANYGDFMSVVATGNKDVFSAIPFDATRLTFDFYDRVINNCIRDTLIPFLNNNSDTIYGCDSVRLFLTTRTGAPNAIGPDYTLQWSNGSTNDTIHVTSNGWYYLQFGFKDQCRTFYDSVYVLISITPPSPEFTSDVGTFVRAIPEYDCYKKLIVVAPDTAVLSVTNAPVGYNVYWLTPSGLQNGISANAYTTGYYECVIETPGGACSSSKCVYVYYYNVITGNCIPQGNLFTPEIIFTNSQFEATDTVTVCRGEYFEMIYVDSTYYANGINDSLPIYVSWTKSGGFSFEFPKSNDTTFYFHKQEFRADSSGNCTVNGSGLDPLFLTPLINGYATRNFYLNVLPTPNPTVVFDGPTELCPDDTVMLTLSGGANYVVTGPGIVSQSVNSDTIYVSEKGNYRAYYYVQDSISGCADSGYVYLQLDLKQAPLLTTVPSNAIICPDDSVQLLSAPGIVFNWYGPLDTLISTNANVYVNVPGLYHYFLTDSSGCTLVSEFKEVLGYTTPYLSANPSNELCFGGEVTLEINTIDSTQIQWLPPLSGNGISQIVNIAGTYSCTVTSCGITTTLQIQVNNSTLTAGLAQDSVTICIGSNVTLQATPNMINYDWQPQNVNQPSVVVSQPGTYFVTVTNANGCTAIDSVVVLNYPAVSIPSVSSVIVCEGDSVTLFANSTGTINWYAQQMNGSVLATGNSFFVPSVLTDTMFFVANSDGICESVKVPINVSINPVSQHQLIAGDTTLCRYDTLNLIAPSYPFAFYSWTGPSNFASTSQSIFISPFDTVNIGYYYLQINDNQCSSPVDSIKVSLFQFSNVNINSNSPVCEGQQLNVTADSLAGVQYSWIGTNGFSSNQNSFSISNTQQTNSGNYVLTFTENGCRSNPDTLFVLVKPLPQQPTITGDSTYCFGDTITLAGSTVLGENYFWNYNSIQVNGSLLMIPFANQQLNTYVYLNAVLNGCIKRDSVLLQVNPEPYSQITSNSPKCTGDTVKLYTPQITNGVYNWYGPNGFSSSNSSNIFTNASPAINGFYYLTVENGSCKSLLDSAEIKVYNYPQFDLMKDTTICVGSSFSITVPPNFDHYNWNNSSFTNSFTVTDTGLVTLTIVNGLNCESKKQFYVDAIDCSIVAPNIFTPNNDGLNDEFEITYGNAKEIRLFIYNRWGELIKEVGGKEKVNWDGTNTSGNRVSLGAYFYVADVVNYFNKQKKLNGKMELIR